MRGIATIKRRMRSLGGLLLRRMRLLPGGVPDRLGDDKAWQNRGFEGGFVLFFPDTKDGLYQLRTWYGPLVALHEAYGLTVVCMDSKTAAAIKDETKLPVMTISQESFLDEVIQRSNVKVFLYVNFTQMNFLALRFRSVVHVSLTHGDSDKIVTVSNQVKAFDYSFVAGQAAIDRFEKYLPLFDAEERCVIVGRPQLDTDIDLERMVQPPAGEKPVALYAPTWEGGHETVSYGSVVSHGLNLVRSLVDAGFKVIYRPHPLTGQRISSHEEEDAAIRRFLSSIQGHEVSLDRPLQDDFEHADVLISDVSSVVNDWLITTKPVIVTRSAVADTREAATRLLDLVPRLTAEQATGAGDVALREVEEDPQRSARLDLLEYYLGDTTPGASLERFLKACQEVANIRDKEWARISANE